MTRTTHLIVLLAALVAGLVGLNLLAANLLSGARLDTTQSGLYRLSDGTQLVIEDIEEPVRWTFYYSRRTAADYPAVRAYGARVRGLLQSYTDAANGRIILTEIDPEPFSEDEEAALAAGLTPTPAGEGDRIFFGLVAENAVDDRQVLASFASDREALLEYDLTRSLADLSRDNRGRLGILTSLPIQPNTLGARPSHIVEELSSAYQVQWVAAGFRELPDVDALLVIHPPRMSDDQIYQLDQFALSGGRMILALDPLALAAFRPGSDGLPPPGARRSSTLDTLLDAWGVEVSPDEVAMDRALGLPVQITEDGRNQVRNYPLWFAIGSSEFSQDDLATSALQRSVNFGSPGHIQLRPVDGLGVRILARTSADGALMEAGVAATNPSPAATLEDYEPAGSPPVLAIRLSGIFPSAFGDTPPRANAAHLSTSRRMGDVVIVADADWLDDPYFLRQDASFGLSVVADNPALLLNLVDLALGDPALLELRSLPSSSRPMSRVGALRAGAEAAYADEQAALETRAAEIQAELDRLLTGWPGEEAPLTRDALQARITSLEAEMAAARDGLRDIERNFRSTIDGLERALRFWTMWLPPILILLTGVSVGVWRQRETLS
ncbi:GldG family protein [Hyphobacterium sp.]|uniref:GldG family protein n=1 Tax=Hyphobacterium sp. TaxID=2004662 RepID=UPI003BADB936